MGNGEGDERTRHAACPVVVGSKWVELLDTRAGTGVHATLFQEPLRVKKKKGDLKSWLNKVQRRCKSSENARALKRPTTGPLNPSHYHMISPCFKSEAA